MSEMKCLNSRNLNCKDAMARAKSFRINKEDEKPKEEKLYRTKTCPCFRCIAIPSLIAFTLLLVLCNVDFEGNAYTTTARPPITRPITSKVTPTTSALTTTIKATEEVATTEAVEITSIELYNNHISSGSCYAASNCNITCSGHVPNLTDFLISQQAVCENRLNIFLNDFIFLDGKITNTFFDGPFLVQTLVIDNCNLMDIETEAFKKYAIVHLTHLSIVNAHLTNLNDATFAGLKVIKHFQLVNLDNLQGFSGHKFLNPMKSTLRTVTVQQKSSITIYNPTEWFDGNRHFKKLKRLNISNNNFRNTLTERTFKNFAQLRSLHLRNCSINFIAASTFDSIASTLVYLDLSHNRLLTMTWNFIADRRVGNPLRIMLNSNPWRCTCDNYELLIALSASGVIAVPKLKCASPREWENIELINAYVNCDHASSSNQRIYLNRNIIETEVNNYTTVEVPETNTTATSDSTKTVATSSNHTLVTTEIMPTTFTTETASTNFTTENTHASTIQTTENTTAGVIPSSTAMPSTTSTSISHTVTSTYHPTSPSVMPTTSTSHTDTTTTTTSPNLIYITCRRIGRNMTSQYYKTLRNYDVIFSLHSITSTSVAMHVEDSVYFVVFYFSPNETSLCDSTQYLNGICVHQRHILSETSFNIEKLQTHIAYLFCILIGHGLETSVFNCRSHYMRTIAWLYTSNTALFIIISLVGVLISFTLGAGITYALLRWRPTWIKGSRRLRKASDVSHCVYLLAKSSSSIEKFTQSNEYYTESVSTNPTGENTYSTNTTVCEYSRGNKPPLQKAPCAPNKNSKHCNKYIETLSNQNYVYSCNTYESVDYYEAVL